MTNDNPADILRAYIDAYRREHGSDPSLLTQRVEGVTPLMAAAGRTDLHKAFNSLLHITDPVDRKNPPIGRNPSAP